MRAPALLLLLLAAPAPAGGSGGAGAACAEGEEEAHALLQTARQGGERAAAKSEGSDGLCMEELCDTVTAPASNPDCGKSFCSACPICSESIGEAGQTLGPDGQPDGKMCIRVVCDQVGDPCSDPSVAASCSGCAECK